ncbi:MAG TPA: hypothetical protein DEH11_22360 [Actinobacteria bacterium]|jgi:hypothetical protein|nr:hypothetical protein [Actinomycetota bacterium]
MPQHRTRLKKTPAKRWIWLPALGAVVVLAVIVVAVAHTGQQHAPKPAKAAAAAEAVQSAAAHSAARHTAQRHPAPAPTYPAALSVAAKVLAWANGSGGNGRNEVSDQAVTVVSEASAGFVPALKVACEQLSGEVVAARSGSPIPDPAAQEWYASALGQFGQAASDCTAATAGRDAALMTRSEAAIAVGNKDLARAAHIIRLLAAS